MLRSGNKYKNSCVLIMLSVMCFMLSGCKNLISYDESQAAQPEDATEAVIDGTKQIDNVSQIENMDIYSADNPDSIAWFYVTVSYGSSADGTDHTFNEVNNAIRFVEGAHNTDDIYAKALVQAGDEKGPVPGMLGYGETSPNAVIRVRGNSSSLLPVKSYKLKLDNNAGLWRGQSNLAMNKHAFDVTRFRNKLYFDILKEIPAVPGIRTQFAMMYIKDETAGKTAFENYGLFTQAEVPTKKYLSNHGMDSYGYLYKAVSFNFEPDAAIRTIDDKEYDAAAMESIISCKGREDNSKLISLINAINDTTVDINYIIDNYFDRDNYEYWLAYNILMGNLDTTMQNFYLYSPLNGNKWYFIPWDGDACLYRRQWALTGEDENYADWESGISNYWGVILHQRFLKYESNRKELEDKVEELHSWLNKDYINEKAAAYDNTIRNYVEAMPDLLHLGYTTKERDYIVSTLGDEVEDNYNLFKKSLDALMPFYIYEVQENEASYTLSWSDAYDFAAEKIMYHLTVSRLPDMSQPVIDEDGISAVSYDISKNALEAGYYYYKVEAYTASGKQTISMNKLEMNDRSYCGVSELLIER